MSVATSPPTQPLVVRAWRFVLFLLYFLRALVSSNIELVRVVLFQRREALAPGFLTYPVETLSKLEILVLSHCITLTPGTTTVEISPDFRRLTVHALDARAPEATLKSIKRDLEDPILGWTR